MSQHGWLSSCGKPWFYFPRIADKKFRNLSFGRQLSTDLLSESVDCELITIIFDQSTPSTRHSIIQLEIDCNSTLCSAVCVYIYLLYSLYGLPSNFRPGFKLGHCRGNIGSILLKVLFRENSEVNRQSWLTYLKQWMHKTCMTKLTFRCLFVWPPI